MKLYYEENGITKMIKPFPDKKYQILYADPPWNETGGGKVKRGADKHYPLMKTKDIIRLPVNKIAAQNSHLYLWTTNNFLLDALIVMNEGMGFWLQDHNNMGERSDRSWAIF